MQNIFLYSAVLLGILCFVGCAEFQVRHVVPLHNIYSLADAKYKTNLPQPVFKHDDAKLNLRDDLADLFDHLLSTTSSQNFDPASPQLHLSPQLMDRGGVYDMALPNSKFLLEPGTIMLDEKDKTSSSTMFPIRKDETTTTTTTSTTTTTTTSAATTTTTPISTTPPYSTVDPNEIKCYGSAKCQLKIWKK